MEHDPLGNLAKTLRPYRSEEHHRGERCRNPPQPLASRYDQTDADGIGPKVGQGNIKSLRSYSVITYPSGNSDGHQDEGRKEEDRQPSPDEAVKAMGTPLKGGLAIGGSLRHSGWLSGWI